MSLRRTRHQQRVARRPALFVLALTLATGPGLVPAVGEAQSVPHSTSTPVVDQSLTKQSVTVTRGGRTFQSTTLEVETAPDGERMRAGSLLVKLRPNVAPELRAASHQAAGAVAVEPLRLPNVVRVQVPRNAAAKALASYRARPDVVWAEPDYVVRAFDAPVAAYTPNDPLIDQQWGIRKISAPDAWDVSRSSPEIKVAVLDCGVFSSSSQFAGPDGSPGHPDIRSKVVLEQDFTDSPSGADDLCDHGTHVAGTVAATTDNGIGVAGIGFNASIINGKVLGDDGSGFSSWVIQGIVWAADSGAQVINMSLGSRRPCSRDYQEAIDYAWARNVVVVASAGNDGRRGAGSPANCNNVIAVAATNEEDDKAGFSQFGPDVHVTAPGVRILSTNNVGDFSSKSGTSMAAPHVAGLAALLWASPFGTSGESVAAGIKGTADPIAGTGTFWIYGRINAAAAVGRPDGALPVAARGRSVAPTR